MTTILPFVHGICFLFIYFCFFIYLTLFLVDCEVLKTGLSSKQTETYTIIREFFCCQISNKFFVRQLYIANFVYLHCIISNEINYMQNIIYEFSLQQLWTLRPSRTIMDELTYNFPSNVIFFTMILVVISISCPIFTSLSGAFDDKLNDGTPAR